MWRQRIDDGTSCSGPIVGPPRAAGGRNPRRGADIEGEAGVGYLMRPGYRLPPLMFDADELAALRAQAGPDDPRVQASRRRLAAALF